MAQGCVHGQEGPCGGQSGFCSLRPLLDSVGGCKSTQLPIKQENT